MHAHTRTSSHTRAQRTVSALCEVQWSGLPSSYDHTARANNFKFTPDECCNEALKKAGKDAQDAWNKQSEYFKDAVSQQTSISGGYNGGAATGSVTQTSDRSQEYAVEYADRKWSVTADCYCLQEGFTSVDGGCNPRTGVNAAVDTVGSVVEQAFGGLFGRKLLDNDCGDAGRKPDSCTIKVQCDFKAVTSGSCDDQSSGGDLGVPLDSIPVDLIIDALPFST